MAVVSRMCDLNTIRNVCLFSEGEEIVSDEIMAGTRFRTMLYQSSNMGIADMDFKACSFLAHRLGPFFSNCYRNRTTMGVYGVFC